MAKFFLILLALIQCLTLGLTEKLHSNTDGNKKLLERVRRQLTPADLNGNCADPSVSCALGNGGVNTVCVIPPMDEVLKCQCAPGFASTDECTRSCTTNADCPGAGVCNGRCSPPCAPIPCSNNNDCPQPLVCNAQGVCQEACEFPPGSPPFMLPPGLPALPPGFPRPPGFVGRKKRAVGTSVLLACTESNGQVCANDRNALCQSGVCQCITGTTRINGLCITDGTVGGRCDGGGRDQCSKDLRAVCKNPGAANCICECKEGTSKISGTCAKDGLAGGKCDDNNEKCPRDRNAICQSPRTSSSRCVCKRGTSLINGMCITDGTCSGRCINGQDCPNDALTVCVDGFCQCRDGTSKVSGMCMRNGAPGGRCPDGICDKDPNAECIDGICQCIPGTTRQQGENCIPDGVPDGNCTTMGMCPGDMMCDCTLSHFCQCKSGTKRIGRRCEGDGLFGGSCYFGKCYGRYARCDLNTYTCYCVPGAIPLYGHCIDARYLHYLQSEKQPMMKKKKKYKKYKWHK